MDIELPDVATLEHIFSNAIAPAFFLGAVAAFVSLMSARLADVNQRIREATAASAAADTTIGKVVLVLLLRRSRLLADSIVLALAAGVCATLLLALLFGAQFLRLSHAYGAAALFIVATVLLGIALYRFAQEALHARNELKETHQRLTAGDRAPPP